MCLFYEDLRKLCLNTAGIRKFYELYLDVQSGYSCAQMYRLIILVWDK